MWTMAIHLAGKHTELAGQSVNLLHTPLLEKEYLNITSRKIAKMCAIFLRNFMENI